jgi:hypothetical protein
VTFFQGAFTALRRSPGTSHRALRELEMANLYEFATCSDAEAIFSGVVRVSVIAAPQGSLLVIRMANDPHGNQNDGCAED